MSSEVKPCNCKHEYQDKKYGKGMRVMAPTTNGFRCVVCSKEVSATAAKKKK